MACETVRHFRGRFVDLAQLQAEIEEFMKSGDFNVQTSRAGTHGTVIQGTKPAMPRGDDGALQALTVHIDGRPNNFVVRIGVGEWVGDLAATSVETIPLTDLFHVIDIELHRGLAEMVGRLQKRVNTWV